MLVKFLSTVFSKNKVLMQDIQPEEPLTQTRITEQTLPIVSVAVIADGNKVNFVAPNSDYNAKVRNAAGDIVGTAEFGVSPLNETVFLYGLDILPSQRRQGYALALLVWLANEYSLPITPIHEIMSAHCFWKVAHQFEANNLVILQQLRCSEMHKEQSRWAHLVPESEAERLIREYKESDEYKASPPSTRA